MSTAIQALDIVFEVREAGASGPNPWLELVCELDDQGELNNDESTVDTKCGSFSGVKEVKGTYSGNAVADANPSTAQASYADVAQWQKDRTLLEYRYYNRANGSITVGSVVSHQGVGRFVNSVVTGTTGEVVQFSWSFSADGDIDVNQPIVD